MFEITAIAWLWLWGILISGIFLKQVTMDVNLAVVVFSVFWPITYPLTVIWSLLDRKKASG